MSGSLQRKQPSAVSHLSWSLSLQFRCLGYSTRTWSPWMSWRNGSCSSLPHTKCRFLVQIWFLVMILIHLYIFYIVIIYLLSCKAIHGLWTRSFIFNCHLSIKSLTEGATENPSLIYKTMANIVLFILPAFGSWSDC